MIKTPTACILYYIAFNARLKCALLESATNLKTCSCIKYSEVVEDKMSLNDNIQNLKISIEKGKFNEWTLVKIKFSSCYR